MYGNLADVLVTCWCSLALVTFLLGSTAGLSCNPCTKAELDACEDLEITRRRCGVDKGVVFNRCKCCASCGQPSGHKCSETKRCAPKNLCQEYPTGPGDSRSPDSFFLMKLNTCTYDHRCNNVTCPPTDPPTFECQEPGSRVILRDPLLGSPSLSRQLPGQPDDDLDHCCGWWQKECRCDPSSCPIPSECPPGTVSRTRLVNGKCCPVHRCVPSDNLCDITECKEKHQKCPEYSHKMMNKLCCNQPKQFGCICHPSLCPTPPRCKHHQVLQLLSKATKKPGSCCNKYICQHVNRTVCHVEDGLILKHMQIYAPSPCTRCTCEAGELVCDEVTCPEDLESAALPVSYIDIWGHSSCSWMEAIPNQCCRECKGCWNREQDIRVPNGEQWTMGDGCTQCSCDKGQVTCMEYSCGSLYGCMNVQKTPGTCCPSCKDDDYKSSISIPSHCSLDVYRSCELRCEFGRVPDYSGCLLCECRKGPNKVLDPRIAGTLCSVEDGSYVHDGYSWNDTCNRSCKCISGHKLCTLLNCPLESLQCKHPIVKLGHCCPTCITEPDSVETIMPERVWPKRDAHCLRQSDGGGVSRRRGLIFELDSCTRCLCSEDGSLMCEERICPPLLCHRPVAVEGQCCPICQEDLTSDISLTESSGTCMSAGGARHSSGSVWRVDFCTACYCDRVTATAHCFHRACAPLTCTRPRYIKGQCCPQCMDDDDVNNRFINPNDGNMYTFGVVALIIAVVLSLCTLNVVVVLVIRKRKRLQKLRRMSRTPLHPGDEYTDQTAAISFQASDTGTKPIYLNSTALAAKLEIATSVDNVAVEEASISASSSEQSISKSDANLCDSRVINNRYQDPSGKEQLRTACAALKRGVVERTHSLVVRIPSVSGRERRANKEKRRSM